jgi:hypothetical protein
MSMVKSCSSDSSERDSFSFWMYGTVAAVARDDLLPVLGDADHARQLQEAGASSSVTVSSDIVLKSEAVRGFSFESSGRTSVTYGP